MTNIADLIPTRFSNIAVRKKALCASRAESLDAESQEFTKIEKSPEEIAYAVLNHEGATLKSFERRALPNLILQSAFDIYQPKFAETVISKYSVRRSFWRRLFNSWLLEFNLSSSVAPLVLKALNKNKFLLPDNVKAVCEKYPILSNKPRFENMAIALISGKMPLADQQTLIFTGPGVVTSKYAQAVLIECVSYLRSQNATDEQLLTFKKLVAPAKNIDPSVKLFAMVGLILGATERNSADATVKEISTVIEENFDDPVTKKATWPSVPDSLGGNTTRQQCLDTVQRWRVFRSITLFFDIIEQVVDSEHKHHFPTRREFWLNYFNRGDVKDAWVILGTKAQEKLISLRTTQMEEFKSLQWAKLSGGPSDQCALLMKVGDITVMEFSHSGRVRMWGAADHQRLSVPRLHRPRYDASELRAECPENQMFRHDSRGRWRIEAQKCLQSLSGRSSKL